MMQGNVYDEFIDWYRSEQPKFKQFATYILKKIKDTMPEYKVFSAYSSAREKDLDSMIQKCKKTIYNETTKKTEYKYSDPKTQITDMAGVRIVAYTVSDLPILRVIIKKLFEIDDNNSIDKKEKLSTDQVGYLSIHYIVSLKPSDPHYTEYETMKCEVQIRTVLQDAWAQVFHDRQYKPFGAEKPTEEMLRETNLLAASLELLDDEIATLAKKYDEFYKTPNNEQYQFFLDEPISETNLLTYINMAVGKSYNYYDYAYLKKVLLNFDIKTIRDFERIFVPPIAIRIKDNIGMTMDKIVLYMIIVKYPEEFFDKFRDSFKLSYESKELLSEFIDEKYINK